MWKIYKIICNLLSIFSPLVIQFLGLPALTMVLIYMWSSFIDGVVVTLTDWLPAHVHTSVIFFKMTIHAGFYLTADYELVP